MSAPDPWADNFVPGFPDCYLPDDGSVEEIPPPDPETDSAEELEGLGYYDEQQLADDAEAPF